MTPQTFSLIEGWTRSILSGDAAHDWEHVRRVLNLACVITAEEPSADADVVIASALLHDVGRPAQVKDPKLDHAAVGADMAYAFLTENGFPLEFSAHVRSCIRTHRFRSDNPPASIEAKILFDADKLDVIGAMGIARTLIFAGATDCPLYPVIDGKPQLTLTEGEDTFFTEYNYKLSRMGGVFLTETGRRLSRERIGSAEAFVRALSDEILNTYRVGQDFLHEAVR